MDLERLERELKKRLPYDYKWGRKQEDNWDGLTNFIYQTYSFETLLKKIDGFNQQLKDYAMNRWYNFWSAMAVENIFCSHQNVVANKNNYDKLIDFRINDIPFDHKTTVFPKNFGNTYQYAMNNEKELIEWLYENQSSQGRQHFGNRLFIVLYDSNGNHWKMKSEILKLKNAIDLYVNNFSENNLIKMDFGNGIVYSSILWVSK